MKQQQQNWFVYKDNLVFSFALYLMTLIKQSKNLFMDVLSKTLWLVCLMMVYDQYHHQHHYAMIYNMENWMIMKLANNNKKNFFNEKVHTFVVIYVTNNIDIRIWPLLVICLFGHNNKQWLSLSLSSFIGDSEEEKKCFFRFVFFWLVRVRKNNNIQQPSNNKVSLLIYWINKH